MKKESYAEMTSRAFKQYELDGAQLEKLHRALLVIIDDVDRVCRKRGKAQRVYSVGRRRGYTDVLARYVRACR